MKHIVNDTVRALRTGKYEQAEAGLFLPAAKLFIGGFFTAQYTSPEGEVGDLVVAPNRVVGQGINLILALLGGHVSSSALYLAPFSGNVTPADGWTGATFASDATEFTDYTPSTRVPWITVNPTAKQLTNAAALAAATITFAAGGPFTVRGCGLIQGSAKGGTTGALVAASRFGADLTGMATGGKLALEYSLSGIDEGDA